MLDDQRPGTIYWIDHYAVGTTDLPRWVKFGEECLGAKTLPLNRPEPSNMFQDFPSGGRQGGFLQPVPLPAAKDPGQAFPRYGFYIREDDVEFQLRRLDASQVPHTDPVHTSADGEEGT